MSKLKEYLVEIKPDKKTSDGTIQRVVSFSKEEAWDRLTRCGCYPISIKEVEMELFRSVIACSLREKSKSEYIKRRDSKT